ncbi:MAG: hypothetical protein U0736_19380 [Gemmataceae bacterium]
MMSQPSERLTVCGVIDPQTANNTTKTTGNIDLSKFHEAAFVLLVGTIDSTVDFKLQESADGSTGWADISGKGITQLTATDDNKQVLVNLKAEELSTGKRYVRGLATLGNGTSQALCAVALGVKPRFGPASDDKAATLAQIVT